MTRCLAQDAIEILQLTHDGDDLDPRHLKLVESAVNGRLNTDGLVAFDNLLTQVRAGYAKPWFHGVTNITRDHEGYVLWKGRPVEHFSHDYAASPEAPIYLREIARRCSIIEARGEVPDTNAVVWRWPE